MIAITNDAELKAARWEDDFRRVNDAWVTLQVARDAGGFPVAYRNPRTGRTAVLAFVAFGHDGSTVALLRGKTFRSTERLESHLASYNEAVDMMIEWTAG